MDPVSKGGVCYSHKGQEDLCLYKVFPKSTCKRKNSKITFKRYGVIEVKYYNKVILVINPRLENIYLNYTELDEAKLVTHVLECIIPNSNIDNNFHHEITYHYNHFNIKTQVTKSANKITYKTYIKLNKQ